MRVLVVADGICLTTGFAQVSRQVALKLVERHHDVHQLCCLESGPQPDISAYRKLGVEPWVTNPYDTIGRQVLPAVMQRIQPDVVYINCDPATADIWRRTFLANDLQVPVVLYAPIEGSPIAETNVRPFTWAKQAYTYTAWSAQALKAEYSLTVPWVYHGVDRAVFHPITAGERAEVRSRLGWTGKYVVTYVGRNAGRKAQDRLLKAFAELEARGERDILLYLHCKSWDNNQLQGWDLRAIAHYCGVTASVQFADQEDAAKGEHAVSLAKKYAASDLYVHAAKVEGFGLPILEAMASGLPIIIPADQGNMQEVAGDAPLAVIDPPDWETWFNGAQLANVLSMQFAAAIKHARENKKLCVAAAERSLERAKAFSWPQMAMTLVDAIERVGAGNRCQCDR